MLAAEDGHLVRWYLMIINGAKEDTAEQKPEDCIQICGEE